jgi:hypothetical protein
MDVTITFRTPFRENRHSRPTVHERTLTEVPNPLAEQMATDFVQHRGDPSGTEKSKLYRYKRDGEEVLVALDFSEIIAITADGS